MAHLDIDDNDVRTTAQMARLELSEEELARFRDALSTMLDYFAEIMEVDVAGLEPTTHAFVSGNRVRTDLAEPCSDTEMLLSNAPEREDGFFAIPNVL